MSATRSSFRVRSGLVPLFEHGPKYLPIDLDFTSLGLIAVNLYNENTTGEIDYVQALYVDNADNGNALTIIMNVTGQRLVIPPYAQGIYPALCSTPLEFVASTTPGVEVMIGCLNVPMPFTEWYTRFAGPLNVPLPPYVGSYVDRSGSIAVGGTPQVLAVANPTRKQMIIYNPISNSESLFINFGAAPNPNVNAIEIPVGQTWKTDNPISSQEIQIVAATSATAFVAKEM